MLLKANRLTKESDFQKVFKNGRLAAGRLIWLKYKKNNSDRARAGFVVGMKISKKATERNKIKRRLRSALHRFFRETSGYDVVIGAKPEIRGKKFSEIVRDLEILLSKIK